PPPAMIASSARAFVARSASRGSARRARPAECVGRRTVIERSPRQTNRSLYRAAARREVELLDERVDRALDLGLALARAHAQRRQQHRAADAELGLRGVALAEDGDRVLARAPALEHALVPPLRADLDRDDL